MVGGYWKCGGRRRHTTKNYGMGLVGGGQGLVVISVLSTLVSSKKHATSVRACVANTRLPEEKRSNSMNTCTDWHAIQTCRIHTYAHTLTHTRAHVRTILTQIWGTRGDCLCLRWLTGATIVRLRSVHSVRLHWTIGAAGGYTITILTTWHYAIVCAGSDPARRESDEMPSSTRYALLILCAL